MGRLCSAATVQLTSHLSSPSVSAGESLRFQSEVSFRVMSEPRECQEKAAPVSKRLTIGTSADHRRSPIAINRDRAITYNWGGWIRTSDLLINSQALCQLSYTPSTPYRRQISRRTARETREIWSVAAALDNCRLGAGTVRVCAAQWS